tara:strand:- start:243 stop:1028 length:786 start_codon:yes stop_codon:yes gene_type:complete
MAKLHDKETQSIAATVSDVLEGKVKKEDKHEFKPHMMYDPKTGKGYKAEKPEDHERMKKLGYVHEKPKKVDEVEQPRVPSGKNGPQTGEVDFKGKHKVKKVGVKSDLDGTIYQKEEVTISIDEKLRAGKGKGTADVDYIGDKELTKKLEKKFKVKIKNTGNTTADIMGDKKNVLNFLMNHYYFDADDVEDMYPDLLEAYKKAKKEEVTDEQSEKQKKYQEFFKKALKRFKVDSPAELDKEGRKKFFDYVDKNYDAGENESD